MKKNIDTKLKPFIAPGSTTKVTKEEIEARKKKIRRAEEIGQRITRVDDEAGYENPYRAKALYYIANGKEVPAELKKKIIEFDEKHNKKDKLHK